MMKIAFNRKKNLQRNLIMAPCKNPHRLTRPIKHSLNHFMFSVCIDRPLKLSTVHEFQNRFRKINGIYELSIKVKCLVSSAQLTFHYICSSPHFESEERPLFLIPLVPGWRNA